MCQKITSDLRRLAARGGAGDRHFHDGHVRAGSVTCPRCRWDCESDMGNFCADDPRFNTLMILMSPSCPSLQAGNFELFSSMLLFASKILKSRQHYLHISA